MYKLKIVYYILLGVYLPFTIYQGIQLIHYKQKINLADQPVYNINGIIKKFILNQEQYPIQNIEINIFGCSGAFQDYSIGIFQGTKQGCDTCTDIEPGFCQKSNTCGNINSIQKKGLFTWRGTTFCVKRVSSLQATLGECKEGFKKCSKILCIPVIEKCPITQIKLLNFKDIDPDKQKEDILKLDEENYLIFERNINEAPINSFKFSYSQYFCMQDELNEERENKQKHILELRNFTGCKDYGTTQQFTDVIDTISELQLYKYNKLYEELNKIPRIIDNIIQDNQVYLLQEKFLNFFHSDCFQQGEQLPKTNELILWLNKILTLYLYGGYQQIFLPLVICVLMIISLFRNQKSFYSYSVIIVTYIFTCMIILSFFIINQAIKEIDQEKNKLEQWINAKCPTTYQKQSILGFILDINLKGDIQNIEKQLYQMLLSVLVILVINSGYLFFLRRYYLSQERTKSDILASDYGYESDFEPEMQNKHREKICSSQLQIRQIIENLLRTTTVDKQNSSSMSLNQ